MKQKPLTIRNSRDVTAILTKAKCPIRMCNGSHRVAQLPDGSKLTYADHDEYGPGTICKITKRLKAVGLLCLAMAFLSHILC
mgnify:CR=1 FL=1